MKSIKFILLFILLASVLNAKSFEIVDFSIVEADFFAETNHVLDRDMEYCSAIKFEGKYPADLDLKEKVYEVKKKDEVPYFFIDADLNQITLQADGFEDYEFVFENSLTIGKVYVMRLNIIKEELIDVRFNVKPENAKIIINDRVISKNNTVEFLKPGKYKINIKAEGFLPLEKEIVINPENKQFVFELKDDFGWLEYKTKPDGGILTINEVEVPEFGKIKLPLGEYEALYKHNDLGETKFKFVIESQAVTNRVFEFPKTEEMSPIIEKTEIETEKDFLQEKTVNNFNFKILSVKKEGGEVIITSKITNLDSDRKLQIKGKASKIYDNHGNEYFFKDHKLANGRAGYHYDIQASLIKDIAVSHVLRVQPKKEDEFNFIPKIVFECFSEEQDFKVIFRDINF